MVSPFTLADVQNRYNCQDYDAYFTDEKFEEQEGGIEGGEEEEEGEE